MILLSALLVCAQAQAQAIDQKIPAPSVDCKALDESACKYNCETFNLGVDLSPIKTGAELVQLKCMEGETPDGLYGFGKELMSCLKCIVSARPGIAVTASTMFWANLCDVAWNQSLDQAVQSLEELFNGYPGGYECAADQSATGTALTVTRPTTTRESGTLKSITTTASVTDQTITGTPTSSSQSTTKGFPGGGNPAIVDANGDVGLLGGSGDKSGSALSRVDYGWNIVWLAWLGPLLGAVVVGL
ncbi:hypothetical protein IAU59_003980 [Kwoniella sp. CBS 9459]